MIVACLPQLRPSLAAALVLTQQQQQQQQQLTGESRHQPAKQDEGNVQESLQERVLFHRQIICVKERGGAGR